MKWRYYLDGLSKKCNTLREDTILHLVRSAKYARKGGERAAGRDAKRLHNCTKSK